MFDYDVIVIGGGPHGLTYANWIRKWRPDTRIAVIDRLESPGYKIGESTLSSATRSFISLGLSQPVLRRLFGNKGGIRFWWTGEETDNLQRHVDVVGIEETYQVERRVLETAMIESARRNGITVLNGVKVHLKDSLISGDGHLIACETKSGSRFSLTARMLCDASGPAALLGRHLGHYRRDPARHRAFTTNSYYAYFRLKKDVQVDHWDEPATRHICFPEGWMWFINVESWEQTPQDRLERMVDYFLDHGDADEADVPTREQVSDLFGCRSERIVSVGFVVRDDHDSAAGLNARDAFRHYVEKYPGVAKVMENYELIETPYEGRPPYGSFRDLVHDSTQFAGDGWVTVGDAAAFVNPLFSPGLNLGSGGCYMAARDTVDALNRGDVGRRRFSRFEKYMEEIYSALISETDLYYRSFRHVDSFEWAFMLKLAFGATDIIDRGMEYRENDPYVHDLLNPLFRDRIDAARAILREGEERGEDPARVARRMVKMVRPFVRSIMIQPQVRAMNLGSLFSNYTIDGRRVEKKHRRGAPYQPERCDQCMSWFDSSLHRCPVCGREGEMNEGAAPGSVESILTGSHNRF